MMKVFYLDVETTGVDPMRHGLVQIAGQIRVGDEFSECFDWKVRPFPEDVIEDEALRVNGQTREGIAAFDAPLEVFARLIETLNQHVDRFDRTDKFHLVAYNATFDERFLRRFFEKCGDKYFGSWFWFPSLCVMSYAAHVVGADRKLLPNFKLETVAAHFGVTREGLAHDAASDIALTRALYERLLGK